MTTSITGNGRIGKRMNKSDVPPQVSAICDILGWEYPSHIPDSPFFCRKYTITPATANRLLEYHHIDNNRRRKPKKIRAIVNDIANGMWALTHQAVAINESGLMFDGQNRCHAIMDSGKACDVLVIFNIPDESMPYTDWGTPRNSTDAATISGREFTRREASLIRVLKFGEKFGERMSPACEFHNQEVLAPSLSYVLGRFPKHIRGTTSAAFLGAVGRAYYHVNIKRLDEFCACLRDGAVANKDDDGAAKKLITAFHEDASSGSGTSHGKHAATFLRTEQAISLFVARQCPQRLKMASMDIYPLPDEVRARLM